MTPGDRRQRSREPAEGHFRRMRDAGRSDLPDALFATPCRFEVYRADETATTSTRFAGGDWHWRLCDQHGQVLVDAGGYRTDTACREAIGILQARAAQAAVWPEP